MKSSIVDFIPERLMQSSLRKKLNDDGLVVMKMESFDADMKGDHFVSAVGHMRVTYVDSQANQKTLPMFVKYLGDKSPKEIINTTLLTLKETRFYDTVLPAMQQFLRKSTSNISLNFSTCYYTNYDGTRDVIALEDLKQDGFRLCPLTSDGLDLTHTKLAFKCLADFHSVSFVMMMKTGYPNLQECPYLKETAMTPEGTATFRAPFVRCFESVMAAVDDNDGHPEVVSLLRRVTDQQVFDISMKTVQNPGPFKALGHRDFWSNNVMFRYRDDTPVAVKLVDMQVTTISPLTLDLNHLLFLSTNIEFRKKHATELLRHYYDAFVSNVTSLGVDDCGFTFDEMVEDLRRRRAYLLFALTTVVAYPLLDKAEMVDPGDTAATSDNPFDNLAMMVARLVKDPKMGRTYKKMFLDVCEEMVYSIEQLSQ